MSCRLGYPTELFIKSIAQHTSPQFFPLYTLIGHVQELLEKCHPLGMFEGMAQLVVAQNMRELYREVLVDTPLAPYFSENLASEDLDEMNIEIMRNTLYKAYLEDFNAFC